MRKLIFMLCLLPIGLWAQKNVINKAITSFMNSAPMRHASFSFLLTDIKTGEHLASINPDRSIIPASTLKLFTTATAFELLGNEFTFKTKLAYEGQLTNGKLLGHLHLIGGGDPALGSPRFARHYQQPNFLEAFVQAVKRAGIKEIQGNLLVDASLYGKHLTPGTWTWEDMGNYWGAAPSALSIYDNTYSILFKSPPTAGQKTKMQGLNQKDLNLAIENHVISSNSRYDNAYIFGAPHTKQRYVLGDIPKSKTRFPVKGAIPNPPELAGKHLVRKLQEHGINVMGQVIVQYKHDPSVKRQEIYSLSSPSLQLLCITTNMRSVNLYAEHMLRQIGLSQMNTADLTTALSVVEEFWAEKGMDTEGMYMQDGSGLSHYNAITAHQMVFLLRYMATQSSSWFGFMNSMPVMGKSGTLKYMGRGTKAAGKVRAKSGSMSRVRAYSGYITCSSGRQLAFFLSANHFSGKSSQIKSGVALLLAQIVQAY